MKRTLKRFILSAFCFALVFSVPLSAMAVSPVSAELRPDTRIVIDGTETAFYNADGRQVYPVLYQGTTYLPVRAIGELMGMSVDWNQSTKTITLTSPRTMPTVVGTPVQAANQSIRAEIRDDFTLVVNNSVRTFTNANGERIYPLVYNGATYLPIRAIGNLMGKNVAWDAATRTVTIGEGSLITDVDTFSGQNPGTTSPGTGTPSPAPSTPTPSGQISVEQAKAKALAHAGLTANQVTFVQQHLDWEHGRQVYEIEFYTNSGYTEYDYEIDAVNGSVISFDYDADHYTPAAPANTNGVVSEQTARSAALAKVPGAKDANITKCRLDRDDGRWIYEVDIRYNGIRYEFEIDGSSGNILEWGMDD